MRVFRFARDLKDLRGTYQDLAAEAARADNEATYKLTQTARGFARRSRRVVDDKLSFSATLMRAGEVKAANRLLDEVQTEVRTEEAALMEQMAEAKVAQAVRREKMTRLRLVRMVAVAVVGSMLMGMSAVGMAAVSYFDDRERDAQRESQEFLKVASVEHELQAHKLTRRLVGTKDGRISGILMKLSLADLKTLALLTSDGLNPGEIEEFLVAALPSPELAHDVTDEIVGVLEGETPVAAPSTVEDAAQEGVAVLDKARKRVKEEAKEPAGEGSSEQAEETAEEPADKKTPDDKEPEEPEGGSSPKLPPGSPLNGDGDGDGSLLD
jgi:hypothetical protein